MTTQIDELLEPVDPQSPAGEDCEYDPKYLGLEALAQGTPESVMGESVIEGTDPDWRSLRRDALELWRRTRDLRVAVYFTIASTELEGLEGLRDGLRMIEYLVASLWDDFYPKLDPDDDLDPTERVNILQMLSPEPTAFGGGAVFTQQLRGLRLVDGHAWTLRDWLATTGAIESSQPVDGVLFDAEMKAVPTAELSAKLAVVKEILALAGRIADEANSRMGNAGYVSFENFERELKAFERVYTVFAGTPASESDAAPAPQTRGKAAAAAGQDAAKRAAPPPQAFSIAEYHPASRSEALLLLKKSAEYFEAAEPTSPVPFLLRRALRMAEMNFIDILAEIDANALDRAREQLGVPKPDNVY